MIKSFRCKYTERIFNDESIPKFKNIENAARRKLEMLNRLFAKLRKTVIESASVGSRDPTLALSMTVLMFGLHSFWSIDKPVEVAKKWGEMGAIRQENKREKI